MASNNITFKIGSVFNGEGFKKARAEVNQLNGDMKKGIAASNQAAAALGQLDGSAGKAANAMTGLINAFMAGGAAGGVVAVAMMGLNMWVEKCNQEMAALKERADALKASVDKAFASALAERMASINAEVKSISAGFESITKQALAFTAALEGVRAASASGGIAQLQVDKLQAMLDAHTEAERVNVERAFDMQIAQAKLTEAEQAGAERVNAATEAYELNKKKVANIDEQLATLGDERASLEQTMLSAKASGDAKWQEIQARVNTLKEQEEALLLKRTEAEGQGEILELKVQQAKEEANTAILNATATVKQAELAEKKLTEAVNAKEYADRKAADEAELEAAALKQEREEKERAVEIQKEVNESANALKKAQDEYAKAVAEYNKNFTKNTINEALKGIFGNGLKSSGAIPVNVTKSVQNTVVDKAVDDAIRNGLVNTVKDADRLARFAAREARNQLNTQSGQRAQEAAKYARLMKTQPENWSKSDADFVAKFEKITDAQNAAKENVQKAKEAVEQAQEHQKKSVDKLTEICTLMKGLGLK